MVQLNRQYGREETASETRKIRVIGVGGAGSNILDRALLDGIDHVELTTVNTDVQSLTGSVANQKIQLGRNLTRGLGSGGDPELGLAAAEESCEEIQSAVAGCDIVFVCAGLGGGTGSGAAPFIAKLAKETGALVLVLVTMPFTFEGRRRCAQAAASLQLIRENSDAVICFENDRMAELTLPRMGIHEAFAAADVTISQSIRAIANLLLQPGLIRLGFDDIKRMARIGLMMPSLNRCVTPSCTAAKCWRMRPTSSSRFEGLRTSPWVKSGLSWKNLIVTSAIVPN
jgi:cell division protein FtsZ